MTGQVTSAPCLRKRGAQGTHVHLDAFRDRADEVIDLARRRTSIGWPSTTSENVRGDGLMPLMPGVFSRSV